MVRGRLLIRTSQSVGAWVLPLPAVVVILMIGVQQLWLLHFEALWPRALSELPLYSGFVQYWTGGGRWPHGLACELMKVNLLLPVYLGLAFRNWRRSHGDPGLPGYLLFLGTGILLAVHEYALYRMADPLPHFVLQRVP